RDDGAATRRRLRGGRRRRRGRGRARRPCGRGADHGAAEERSRRARAGGADVSFDMNKLMQQAQQMQEQVQKMQEEAAEQTAEASVGGGMVKVTANGAGEVLSITISPEAIDPT